MTAPAERHASMRRQLGAWGVVALLAASPAYASSLPEDLLDDALADAIEQQADGQVWRAEATLRRLAGAGNLLAMERLALLHWYGLLLYPDEPWSREEALLWFRRAAALGSELGRHMVAVAERKLARGGLL